MNHIGIYLSNEADENKIIERIIKNKFLTELIDLSKLFGMVYSTSTIETFIDEELNHDKFILTNKSLLKLSSGQLRVALLTYILSNSPQYLVLDDIAGSLDQPTKEHTIKQLNEISNRTLLIQLFHRKTDMLESLNTILTVDNNNDIKSVQSVDDFKRSHQIASHTKEISLPGLFSKHESAIDPLVALKNINVSYNDKPVLKDINWTIRPGEFWQLAGPNGSGKSTLLSMIIGDNPKAYGQDMMLFGHKKGSGESVWELKKHIGYFTPAMITHFKHNDRVENMIISGLVDSVGLYTKPNGLQKQIASDWMHLLGLSDNYKKFSQLSFGQQRIVMVARAMIKYPSLLILDEPTVGLDEENASTFISMVKAIAQPRKVAIIYVSHRQEPELMPDKTLNLIPTEQGSKGFVDFKNQ